MGELPRRTDNEMRSVPPRSALAHCRADEAARIPLTDEAVLASLRGHFSGIDSMHLRPFIPGKKELAARSVHAHLLPSDERVLALFDDTLFGSGDEGFVVTSRRLCCKNPRGRAQMIEWANLDPEQMYVERGKLVIGHVTIELSGERSVLDACEAAFHVLAFSARSVTKSTAQSGIVLRDSSDGAGREASHVAELTRASDRPTYRPSQAPRASEPPALAPRAAGAPPSVR